MAARVAVIDCGSGTCKAGYSGETTPRAIFPTIIGQPRHKEVILRKSTKTCFVGSDAQARRGMLTLTFTVQRGQVQNWRDFGHIFQHALLNELRVEQSSSKVVMVTEPFLGSEAKRQLLETIFTTDVSSVTLVPRPLAALYSAGKSTGVVFDSGEGLTTVTPVFQGKVRPQSVAEACLAGRDVTDALIRLLTIRGASFSTTAEQDIAREMKEQVAYVAQNYEQEAANAAHSSALTKAYELPDGQVLCLGEERFECAEVLFKPDALGLEKSASLPRLVLQAVQACPETMREELLGNIVLVGGTTTLPGFRDRLSREVFALLPHGTAVNIVNHPDPKFAAWQGASKWVMDCGAQAGDSITWVSKEQFRSGAAGDVYSEDIFKLMEQKDITDSLPPTRQTLEYDDNTYLWVVFAMLLPIVLLLLKYVAERWSQND